MCRAYYRNRVWIGEVEPNTLWQRDDDTLVLVDEDNFVPLPYSANQAKFDRAVLTPEEKQKLFTQNNPQ